MAAPVRVLVVDDSAFARKVLREVLEASPYIEVVGIARDGLEALEKIAELSPDVITLDLVMPNLDGVGVLRALPKQGGPRVVVVSISDAESELALTALSLGAIDLVAKPTALATDRLYELADELVRKVRSAAGARVPAAPPSFPRQSSPPPPPRAMRHVELVVIGTSTGGPQALTHLLTSLPASFPVPIAVALHIPPGYTRSLARRLDEASAIDVIEATGSHPLRPGQALIAPGGQHLKIVRRDGALHSLVSSEAAPGLHAPSVDLLFESAASAAGGSVLGVVLTGMGDDGCRGAGAIRAAGGQVLTESADSCVVYGMPRSVVDAGFSTGSATLEAMATLIASRV
ncbi:MAG: chemotaxis-specific protein-glutamate methyltransferase CheB [Polyangiales bacterium]